MSLTDDKNFISKVINAFKLIKKEISEAGPPHEGMERQFRHSLAQHLLAEVLGWTREVGKGHYFIGEVRDITCFDEKKFPVILVETKDPAVDITTPIVGKLGERVKETGSVRYGAITNGRIFELYEPDTSNLSIGLKPISAINIDYLIAMDVATLPDKIKRGIIELKRLSRDNFIFRGPEYFEKHYREIPIGKTRRIT